MSENDNSRTCLGPDDVSAFGLFSEVMLSDQSMIFSLRSTTPSPLTPALDAGHLPEIRGDVIQDRAPLCGTHCCFFAQWYFYHVTSECYYYCFGPSNKFNPGFIDPGMKGDLAMAFGRDIFIHHHRPFFLCVGQEKERCCWVVVFGWPVGFS